MVQTALCERPLQSHCELQNNTTGNYKYINLTIKSFFVQIHLKFYTKTTKQNLDFCHISIKRYTYNLYIHMNYYISESV